MHTFGIFRNTLVRQVAAKVELCHRSSTNVEETFTYRDALISIDIDRVGEEGKFFGFLISQKATIKLKDKDRRLNITKNHWFRVYFSSEGETMYFSNFPRFWVTEVSRDENTNDLTIVAWDSLHKLSNYTVAQVIGLNSGYTVDEFITEASLQLMGNETYRKINITMNELFDAYYAEGANFDGTETMREALTACAEITGTICYLNYDNDLVFKSLDVLGAPEYKLDKSQYFTFDCGDKYKLKTIYHVTEVGDNIYASAAGDGIAQYLRNNPFLDLKDDAYRHLELLVAQIGWAEMPQFDCTWRGNPRIEIGDKISIANKDNEEISVYLLNDTISYNGGYSQHTQWNYKEDTGETPANPVSLGDALKQTYARVDKAKKDIEFLVSDNKDNQERLSKLELDTGGIKATVEEHKKIQDDAILGLEDNYTTLSSKVELAMTSDDVTIAIQTELSDGVNKVKTVTNEYTFDDTGLTIAKSDSEIKTQITEDGMTVYKENNEVLTADNTGVKALNLHATTYLKIGKNSRFEDYGNRTGCFWIG